MGQAAWECRRPCSQDARRSCVGTRSKAAQMALRSFLSHLLSASGRLAGPPRGRRGRVGTLGSMAAALFMFCPGFAPTAPGVPDVSVGASGRLASGFEAGSEAGSNDQARAVASPNGPETSQIALRASSHQEGARQDALRHEATGTGLPEGAEGPVSRSIGRGDQTYWAVRSGDGVVLHNPAQRLRAQFDRHGVVVRSGKGSLGLRLTGYGSDGHMRAVKAISPKATANRVVYQRGGIKEWYDNGPLGLEQGFTIADRPAKSAAGGLTLAIALTGNMHRSLSPAHNSVDLSRPGVSLAYRGLAVNDARGRRLPAHLDLRGDRLQVRIDDRRAKYPVSVDPFVQQAKLTASDSGSVSEALGESVAVSADGNTVVAGAPRTRVGTKDLQGAAYVFVKPQTGWANAVETAKLTASDGVGGEQLGLSVGVSADGNTVVAGAPIATVGGQSSRGAAYVFVKPQTGWASTVQTAKLTTTVGAVDDQLGTSVGISADGNTVVAGAPIARAVYVFLKPQTGWANEAEAAKLTAASARELGFSVAVSADGNTAVGGAPATSDTTSPGSAFVFVKPQTGWASTTTPTAKLTPSDSAAADRFGWSVAISGDANTVAGGAPFARVGDQPQQGAAYVFAKPQTGWADEHEETKLTASDGVADDQLGYSTAVTGDGSTVVAGAPHRLLNAIPGAAYVFVNGTQTKLTASDGRNGDVFGWSVAITADGNTLVAGAPAESVGPHGAAYVFGAGEAGHSTSTDVSCTPSSVAVGQATTCTATVTDTAAAGQTTPAGTVSVTSSGAGTLGGNPCTLSETNPGEASCQVTYTPSGASARTDTITANYSGDSTHATSSGTTTVSVTTTGLHSTSTDVSCTPSSVAVGQATTCTATVTDTAAAGQTTPAGTVSVTSSGAGTLGGNPCTLSETNPGEASCQVTYTPSGASARTDTITANYSGDSTHATSSGTTTVSVTPGGLLALAWGAGGAGQLGNGGNSNVDSPVAVDLPAGVRLVKIAAGESHSLALTTTGEVLAWGANADGQLGDGTNAARNRPVLVKLPANTIITDIAAGGNHSLALTTNGDVLAWGDNADGQLGNGSNEDSNVPVEVD
ncbi:Ig-like domain repeat protein, partial [Actinopolymorpha sp. NPDC004070]|uniref:Ig-like domain repeat protein n=1 Tax=Actinopolymorpha sp. NPDC004070 TaxID=3154548 RepID=UPI00339E33F0